MTSTVRVSGAGSSAPTGAFIDDVLFPLSPDYVKGWTADRAVAELIANAIDVDPDGFSVTFDGGLLTIEDRSERGVGQAGMILGHSNKRGRTDVIGQFGEGLKIGLLVLIRDRHIGDIHVDTVGYSFTPHLVPHVGLAGLAGIGDEERVEVMSWKVYHSARRNGTRVTIACPAKVAERAISRFLHLTRPGYRAPHDHPVVMFDGPGGRVYIGGVLVSDRPGKLAFSYDLPLELAKQWQNRDRSVLDTWQLRSAVLNAIAHVDDADGIERLVGATLNGELSDDEAGWPGHDREMSARTRGLIRDAGRRRWPDGRIFYRPGWNTEQYDDAILDLVDRGYSELTVPKMHPHLLASLASLLGVDKPKQVSARRATNTQKTTWVPPGKLSADEVANLDRAVRWLRAVYGPDAVGEVRVYSATCLDGEHPGDLAWRGFYEPTSGRIALHRDLLGSFDDLLDTLTHETGHRIAHRYPHLIGLRRYVEHADRTRGFEQTLHTMAARAVAAAARGVGLEQLEAEHRDAGPYAHLDPAPDGLCWTGPAKRAQLVANTAARAAERVQAALATWAAGHDVTRSPVAAFAAEHHVSATLVRHLTAGTAGANTPFARVVEVCEPLGLAAASIWWAQCGALGPFVCRGVTPRTRKFAPVMARNARAANGTITDPELVARLELLAGGKVPIIGTADWLAPIEALLDAG